MDDTVFTPYNVVCHTPGCENAEYTIQVMAEAAGPTVMCGPCARIITDITPVTP